MNSYEIIRKLEAYRSQKLSALGLPADADVIITSAYSFITLEGDNLHIQFEVKWPEIDSKNDHQFILPDEIIKQLATADSIASLAVNCTTGDGYEPGNFSKIILSNSEIELQQINHMNAKSLAHKKNYSLRSLIFKIDLKNPKELKIDFSDHSSENNKHCGDQIKAAIANLASPSQEKP